ncbi:MAG: phage holin family protein [Alteraurantiacibacter sp.]
MEGEREADAAPVPSSGPEAGFDELGEPDRRSLVDDIEDLLVDARTWLDAEFTYQKTRAGFVAGSLKAALALVVGAAIVALVAFIGLTVGAIVSLIPVVGPVGATGIVVGVLLLICAAMLGAAARRWRDVTAAIREDRDA